MTDTDNTPALGLGSLWEIKAKDSVRVTRPDGSEVTVASDGKVAGHVLDVPGTYTAAVDGKTQSITVG